MLDSLAFVIFLVAVALVFDFINGFHDSANSIATIVSTQVLPPKYAVIWAAFFNFAAVFFIGVPVANTIGTGIIHPDIIDNLLIFSALGAAIIWNLITWYFGLPSSSSHALIGGLIGAGMGKGGSSVLVWSGINKATIFIVVSPMIGMILGLALMILVLNLSRRSNPSKLDHIFRKLQLFSAATYSLGHGMNDAQKTMGIIAMVLFGKGLLGPPFYIPFWVVFLCFSSKPWEQFRRRRIVKTMGTRITKLRPMGGFCAETAAAISIIGASLAGIPVSTTHTITGAIVGVGSTIRLTAVRWGIAGNIIWAWILTIPVSSFISALLYFILKPFLQ
jgi:PiT family inorganic phosphate transporter